jgi:predicted dehydrogenase
VQGVDDERRRGARRDAHPARRDRQLVEQATHLFDLVRMLIGEPSSIATLASRADRPAYPDADIDDAAAVTLGFPSGAVAALSATCVLAGPHAIGLRVMGEGLAVDIAEDHMVVSTASGTEVVRAGVDPFVAEDADFLRAVRDGTSAVRAPYADALRTHRLAAAAANGA